MPDDGGHLILDAGRSARLLELTPSRSDSSFDVSIGSQEFINGDARYCLWIDDDQICDGSAVDSSYRGAN